MNYRKRRSNQGFTIIEIMIAIAIVAILVALAVPAYSDYSVRAKVAECIAASAVPKLAISEYVMSEGAYPPNAELAGIDDLGTTPLTDFCQRFEYGTTGLGAAGGDFAVWVNSAAVGVPGTVLHVEFFPTIDASGTVNWQCTRGDTLAWAQKFLPPSCRGEYVPPVA
ncbi:MAG: prepilin-type N-terminal cleavage/methylation domain-containing protein [Xanthomonadales bacterium]|nr:prepilin-type N-terminal cleavage/methylation domain-containing protein [Xanthomonadales bacterium]